MDWQDIPHFLALARGGTLSAAARALRVNHATVSRRVAALEERLGAPLFERTPAGYVLTAAGRGVLARAEAMEAAAAAIPEAVGADGAVTGIVRVTLARVLADGFVACRLAPLLAAHPGLEVGLAAESRTLSLARREADIALRLARPRRGALLARRVAVLDYGFFATADWRDRLAGGEPPVFVAFDADSMAVPEAAWARQALSGARACAPLEQPGGAGGGGAWRGGHRAAARHRCPRGVRARRHRRPASSAAARAVDGHATRTRPPAARSRRRRFRGRAVSRIACGGPAGSRDGLPRADPGGQRFSVSGGPCNGSAPVLFARSRPGPPSSSGPGRRPLTAETGVRFPLGVPKRPGIFPPQQSAAASAAGKVVRPPESPRALRLLGWADQAPHDRGKASFGDPRARPVRRPSHGAASMRPSGRAMRDGARRGAASPATAPGRDSLRHAARHSGRAQGARAMMVAFTSFPFGAAGLASGRHG